MRFNRLLDWSEIIGSYNTPDTGKNLEDEVYYKIKNVSMHLYNQQYHGLKKEVVQEVANFRRSLQISGRILTDSCKFPTE